MGETSLQYSDSTSADFRRRQSARSTRSGSILMQGVSAIPQLWAQSNPLLYGLQGLRHGGDAHQSHRSSRHSRHKSRRRHRQHARLYEHDSDHSMQGESDSTSESDSDASSYDYRTDSSSRSGQEGEHAQREGAWDESSSTPNRGPYFSSGTF